MAETALIATRGIEDPNGAQALPLKKKVFTERSQLPPAGRENVVSSVPLI